MEGSRIREIRQAAELTQKEFLSGYPDKRIDPALLSKIENDIIPPPWSLIEYALTLCWNKRPPEEEQRTAGLASLDYAVLSHIGIGPKHAVKRDRLVQLTGASDRAIRDSLHNLKAAGYKIVNLGTGYYKPDNPRDQIAYFKREYARAQSVLKIIFT